MILTGEEIKKFPTTRYQGSKRKILSWLYENLKELSFDTALDAFGGTGSVSYLFKLMGKSVTYNDQLKFNQIIGKAIIENSHITLDNTEINELIDISRVDASEEFINNTFNDVYYTENENKWIDSFLVNVDSIFPGTSKINDYKKSIALFSLFQACLTKRPYNLFHRKNLYMRTNDVKRNFGNKVTWEKSFEEQIRKFANEANASIFDGVAPCYSINESAFALQNSEYDLIYIDPPYVDKNGDHDTIDYTYCYHFLEGIARYDEWESLIDHESKNLRFKREHYADFFKRKNILDSFTTIFERFQKSIIVVSYKQNGVPSIEEIEQLMGKFKKRVYKQSMHYKYALNKQNGNAVDNREVLLIGI